MTGQGFQDLTVLVLAGGRGTRISAVHPTVPKPLIPVHGRPFLSWLTDIVASFGPRAFVYSTGHMADQLAAWAADGSMPSVTRRVRAEEEALGTARGVFNCLDEIDTDWVLVVNGDGVCLGGVDALLALRRDPDIDGGLIGVRVEDASRYGSLDVGSDGMLRAFREKAPGRGYINSGFYLFRHSLLSSFRREGPCSLERDVIPDMIGAGRRLGTVLCEAAPFIDIGTPESLAEADRFIEDHVVAGMKIDRAGATR